MPGAELTVLPLVVRHVVVDRVSRVNPRTIRVRVTGPELAAFTKQGISLPAFSSPGFDDHVKLIFSTEGKVAEALPIQREHGIDWPRCDHRAGRDYTVRTVTADGVELDFVDHGPGPAASWARNAQPGDPLWFAGPKSSLVLPDDLDWIVLFGDETALPAIGRFLEDRTTDARVHVVAAIPDDQARQSWPLRDGDTIRWEIAPAGDAEVFDRIIRDIVPTDGAGFVWGAAESRSLIPVRRHLRREQGLAKDRMDLTGYWHLRQGEGANLASTLRQSSPLPWLVIRAGIQLGVLDALALGPRPAAELAAAVDLPVERLQLLIPRLLSTSVLRHVDDKLGLGPAGELLLDDEHLMEGFDGVDAEVLIGLADLATALRTDANPWQLRSGSTLWQKVVDDPEEFEEQIEEISALEHMLPGLENHPVWQDVRTAAITGPGSALLVTLLSQVPAPPAVTVVGPSTVHPALRASLGQSVPLVAHLPTTDLAIDAGSCSLRSEAELVAHLEALRASAPQAVLLGDFEPDELSPSAQDHGLASYGAVGRLGGRVEVERLAVAAGWSVQEWTELGWGFSLVVLG